MKREDIVLLSTADWDNPFWTNKQHVAVQLAKRGHRVFYIDSLGLRRPTASTQDIKRVVRRIGKAIRPPRLVRENLWVWSPVVLPFQGRKLIRNINFFLLNNWLLFWLRKLGFKKSIFWTYNPLTSKLLNLNIYEKIVYHCVDEIKAQPGMPVDVLEQAEQELTERSDIVFVTAPKLYETRKVWNANTFYFPNVADYDHFSRALHVSTTIPQDLINIPSPRLGFIGAISGYKVDFQLLRFIAESRPDCSLVLIGKVGEGDPWTDTSLIAGLPNVYLLGPRPYGELPRYLKGFDVALLPNKLNEYTDSMFPMKFFEYLAAGRFIVSVNLPSLRDFKDIAYIAKSADDFLKGIDLALAGEMASLANRLAVARAYTYESRTEKMMKLVEELGDSGLSGKVCTENCYSN